MKIYFILEDIDNGGIEIKVMRHVEKGETVESETNANDLAGILVDAMQEALTDVRNNPEFSVSEGLAEWHNTVGMHEC